MLADPCTALLPDAPQLRLETLHVDSQTVALHVTSLQVRPLCPDCGHSAHRIHSRYQRTLADLPWSDKAARIHLHVRRFFCDQPACARRTFAERLPDVAAAYARRTQRLAITQQDVGQALGGAAGARLTAQQHMPASRNTLLRLIRQLSPPAPGQPRVIGIDDWAQRKGHTYGTIIVDLEKQEPIDLLGDRSAETVESWLRTHPGVGVISRDRAGAYASGAAAGAPEAVQVADRWHVLKNLREAVEEELTQRRVQVGRTASVGASGARGEPSRLAPQIAVEALTISPSSRSLASTVAPLPAIYSDTPSGRRAEARRQARRDQRLHQYTQAVSLHAQGLDQATIARQVEVSRRTVTRWLALDGFPERRRRHGDRSGLDAYKSFLLEQWQLGCHNAAHLWRMLRAQGFAGSYSVVAGYLACLRRQAVPATPTSLPSGPTLTTKQLFYTARQAAFLFLRRPTDLTESEQQDLTQVQDAALTSLYTLTQNFARLLRERQVDQLDPWLQVATTSTFPALRRFAYGLERDYAAVRAGLELPWSQGQVEGQITRLKLVERQMYGRAKLDLLRQRILHAA